MFVVVSTFTFKNLTYLSQMYMIGHENIDIERYSAKDATKTRRKPSLSDCIKMTDEYVPAELGEDAYHHSHITHYSF